MTATVIYSHRTVHCFSSRHDGYRDIFLLYCTLFQLPAWRLPWYILTVLYIVSVAGMTATVIYSDCTVHCFSSRHDGYRDIFLRRRTKWWTFTLCRWHHLCPYSGHFTYLSSFPYIYTAERVYTYSALTVTCSVLLQQASDVVPWGAASSRDSLEAEFSLPWPQSGKPLPRFWSRSRHLVPWSQHCRKLFQLRLLGDLGC